MPVASILENGSFMLGEETFDLTNGHLLQGDSTVAARQQTLALADIVTQNHTEMGDAIAKAKAFGDGGEVMTHKFLEISECLRPCVNVGVTSISHDGCGDGGVTAAVTGVGVGTKFPQASFSMYEYGHGSELTSIEVVANGLLIEGDIFVKAKEGGLDFLASEKGPAFIIVIDHHSLPLQQGFQLLKDEFPELLAKTYFVADFTGTKAAGTLASEFFEGLVEFTDVGKKIVKTAQANDLFKPVAEEDKSFKNNLVGWFDKNGFESCHPCDVFQLFCNPSACLDAGHQIFTRLVPLTEELFENREVVYKDEQLVMFWIPCVTSYDKLTLQELMDAEGRQYENAAVLFVTHNIRPSGGGMCSVGFRIAQEGKFEPWKVKIEEQCDFDYSAGTRCALLKVSSLAKNLWLTNTKLGFKEGGGHDLASRSQFLGASEVGQNVNLLKRKVLQAAFIQLDETAEEFARTKNARDIAKAEEMAECYMASTSAH